MTRRALPLLLLLASPLLAADPPKLDRHGMPLPPGAIARLGDARLRHVSPVSHLAFSADSTRLLTLCEDQSVHVWDTKTSLPVAQLSAGSAQSAALPPDGRSLIVIDPKGHFKQLPFVDVRNPMRDERIEGYTGGLAVLAADGGSFAYLHGARDEEHYHIIRVADWKVTAEIASPRPGLTREVAFSGDGKRVAFIDGMGEEQWGLRVHEAEGGKLLFTRAERDRSFSQVSLDGTGSRVAAAHRLHARKAMSASAWEVATAKPCLAERSPDPDLAVALSRDGLLVGLADATNGRVAQLYSAKPVCQLATRTANRLTFDRTGDVVAVAYTDHSIELFDARTGASRLRPNGEVPTNAALAFHPDNRLFVFQRDQGKYQHWDLRTGSVVYEKALPRDAWPAWLPCVAASDGRRVAYSRWSGAGEGLWDFQTGRGVKFAPVSDEPGREASRFTNDGRYLAITEKSIQVFDPNSGARLHNVKLPAGTWDKLAISADGQTVALVPGSEVFGQLDSIRVFHFNGSRESFTARWQATPSIEEFVPPGWNQSYEQVLLTPNGRTLVVVVCAKPPLEVTGQPIPVAVLYEVATGLRIRQFRLTSHEKPHVTLAPDGRTVVSSERDGTRTVWDTQSGKARTTLEAGSRGVAEVISPDSRYLVTTSRDRTALVWVVQAPEKDPDAAFAGGLSAAWEALALRETEKPHAAIVWLAARPTEAVPFLAERVKAPDSPSAQQVAEWIKQLDANAFRERETAEAKLRGAVRDHAKTLEDAVAATTSPEVRQRLRKLLAVKDRWQPSADEVRALRAIEVLERIGTPAAQNVLKKLAAGPPEAWVTRDATATLDRLAPR